MYVSDIRVYIVLCIRTRDRGQESEWFIVALMS
jgi:hypothetical protein